MDSEELARRIGLAWEKLPEPRHPFSLEIIPPGRPSVYVNLGPHPPRLWPEDLDRTHDLWLRLQDKFGSKLHHRDVVGVALRRLEKDLEDGEETGGERSRARIGRCVNGQPDRAPTLLFQRQFHHFFHRLHVVDLHVADLLATSDPRAR